MIVPGEPTVYRVVSRTALDAFVLGDVEGEYLLKLPNQIDLPTAKPTLRWTFGGTLTDVRRR